MMIEKAKGESALHHETPMATSAGDISKISKISIIREASKAIA